MNILVIVPEAVLHKIAVSHYALVQLMLRQAFYDAESGFLITFNRPHVILVGIHDDGVGLFFFPQEL